MGKFTSLPATQDAPKIEAKCGRCGWLFNEKHEHDYITASGEKKKRAETRDQIWIRGVIRCGTCYELELIHSGRHRYADCEPVLAMQRSSITLDQDIEAKRIDKMIGLAA